MSRTTGPSSSESSAESRRGVTQLVCPFCGTVSETPGVACRQCGMENSQATRSATRSKIGPWYVWQARNPSAPGMNWATLISLIERGRVTPRSVVRGPTTGQLWRFAARVKGVSREFGSCWHCGGEIQRNARLCPACKRLQQTPANPDSLLETDLYVAPTAPRPPVEAEPAREVAPQPRIPEDGQPLPLDPLPSQRLPRGPVPIVDVTNDSAAGDFDMRAFDLPEDYVAEPRRGSGVFRKMLVAAIIAILCGVAAGGYSPPFREAVVKQYYAIVARFSHPSTEPTTQPAPTLTPIATPSRESITAAHRQAPATRPAPPIVHVPNDEHPAKPPEVSVGPGPRVNEQKPRKSIATKPVTVIPTMPSQSVPSEKIQIGGGGGGGGAPPVDTQTADRWAWERYEQAIKNEQKQEYTQAVKDYEWILALRLPEGVGPTDVQTRLDRVKVLLQQQR